MDTTANYMYREILIIGMGTFPIAIHDALAPYGIRTTLVEYGPESDYFKHICAKKQIEYENLSSDHLTDLLHSKSGSTLIISAINKYIFPSKILLKPNIVAINYHNSVLPHHKGSHAEAFSLFDMDEYTGITWHYVTEKIDGGDVIATKELKINHDDTSISLLSRQNKEALEVFREFLPKLLTGKIAGTKQVVSAEKLHSSKDAPGDGLLNPEWPIDKIYAFLRSFDYGGLEIIQQPQFVHEEKSYTWQSYALVPKGSKNNEIILDAHDHSIEIHKAGSDHYINLKGVVRSSQPATS